jgi:glycosyltransferase involved in cell wall biosynthesis
MKKIMILSVFPAPYRVGVFKQLSKNFDITLFFERLNDESRSSDWFVRNTEFPFDLLLDGKSKQKYKQSIKNLNQYDVVLVYDYSTVTAMKLMLKCIFSKKKYILNCDGAFINSHPIKDRIKKFFIKRAAACFANGEHAKQYFLNYGAKEENIHLHNFSTLYEKDILQEPLPISEKELLRKELDLPNGKIIVSVGQFIFRKGYDILLNACRNISSEHQLIIIGGGEKEQEYRQFIEKYKLENVKILGFKSKNEIFKYYKAADLFILPTREDIWGLVINESMACGLPVITTDKCIAGLELVKCGENGFIVPVEDASQLANKINCILSDNELQEKMGEKSLELIKPYTIENVAKGHTEVLKNILGE